MGVTLRKNPKRRVGRILFLLLILTCFETTAACLKEQLKYPPTEVFLAFMNSQKDNFHDRGILVHARTLPYQQGGECRFAYQLK